MDEGPRHDGSFIVRIWWERGENLAEPRRWRGWVQHARNGKHSYFQSLAALCTFIAEESGVEGEGEQPSEGIG